MIALLRWIGVLNVAVWLGAVVFFTVGVVPGLFSHEMQAIIGEQNYPALGRMAMVLVSRYFLLHYWCATIALLHQLAERFYLGKALERVNFGILVGLCSLSLVEGAWLQPSLRKLHQIKYGKNEFYTPAEKRVAIKSFRIWHGASYFMNFLVMGGLGVYFWRIGNPENAPRFVPAGKFRS